jgi:hypothetical protein
MNDAHGRTLGKFYPQQGIAGRQMRPSPFVGKEKTKASPPCGEGSLREKASPLAGRKWRRLGTYPEGQDLQACGERILPRSPCHPPRCRCSRPGGPSTFHLACSMKGKDKNSPSSGQTKALPVGRPLLHSGEELSANTLAGKRRR